MLIKLSQFLKKRHQKVSEGFRNFLKVTESSGVFQNVLTGSKNFQRLLEISKD
jgi:hypothetical protein